ncbi:MAG: hypothetical protein ACKPKO_10340, partial [Candidatus Fonsibacter sp.]
FEVIREACEEKQSTGGLLGDLATVFHRMHCEEKPPIPGSHATHPDPPHKDAHHIEARCQGNPTETHKSC